MSTPITVEDRAAAHALMVLLSYGQDHCRFWSARTKLALHDPECTAIAQALADRGAVADSQRDRAIELAADMARQLAAVTAERDAAHADGRRGAFDHVESLIDHHLEATEDWKDDVANFRAAVRSACDRGPI